MLRETVFEYIKDTYNCLPDYPFEKDKQTAVFRHGKNRKWFAIVMSVQRKRLGLSGEGEVNVMNIKSDSVSISFFSEKECFLPGYHMNKNHWLSVVLDMCEDTETVKWLIDRSFNLTK